MNQENEQITIGILGLGYVGLPLACLFSGSYRVIGHDINPARVKEISSGYDSNGDILPEALKEALRKGLTCTTDPEELRKCNVYIVTVPTPVNRLNRPDLTPLKEASAKIGALLKHGDTVIYESTVYPGTTEEECVPVLEKVSGLKFNSDFFVGYSPERINPGDATHPVAKVSKIVSGSNATTAMFVDRLYSSVLDAPTFRAASIKVAEAAKVLENTQRDVNIALMNEMAKVCNALGIDTNDVIDAASTKWNFMSVRPGLVGGHCIGVDPYYLIEKARSAGVEPHLIATARCINDGMPGYVAEEAQRLLQQAHKPLDEAEILILGFTFKENCRDTRNTKIADIYRLLEAQGAKVDIYDPNVEPEKVKKEFGIPIISSEAQIFDKKYDLIIYGVNHSEFRNFDIKRHIRQHGAVYDLKGGLSRDNVTMRL